MHSGSDIDTLGERERTRAKKHRLADNSSKNHNVAELIFQITALPRKLLAEEERASIEGIRVTSLQPRRNSDVWMQQALPPACKRRSSAGFPSSGGKISGSKKG